MWPILLRVGPLTIYTYGVMLVASFLTATWLASRFARQLPQNLRAISAEQTVDLTCLLLLGGIVGGRLFYVLLYWGVYTHYPQEILAIWHGGLIWYGGFIGGYLALWLYVRAKGLSSMRVADQLVPFGALGHAIGRIGCFLNGCCYGRPTNGWWAVRFPGHAGGAIPTQLLESAGLFILYVVLRRLQRPKILMRPGRVFGCYVISYSLLRFGLEFLRGDQSTWWVGLTLQQLISLGLLLVGAGVVWSARPPASAAR